MTDVLSVNAVVPHVKDIQDPFIQEVLRDYYIACVSRETSILSRKEVLTGKAKFGISGDGKELPQLALARVFQKGDFRSGYYRDQTIVFALGLCSVEDYLAQLYADPFNDPFSGGRQMSSHFATRFVDKDGSWLPLKDLYNITSDISPTAGQMARGLGLALASRKFRNVPELAGLDQLSNNGNEVVFVTIGDASTSEGIFFETMNAAAVTRVPMVVSVWDDGYGISVPKALQTVKESISKALEGFLLDEGGNGIYIYTVKAWDYPGLCEVYEKAAQKAREKHIPVLVHVQDVTQPLGHSTSGSHERYKSQERLQWELDFDCVRKMAEWIVANEFATAGELEQIKSRAKEYVRECKVRAWEAFTAPANKVLSDLKTFYQGIENRDQSPAILELEKEISSAILPGIAEIISNARRLRYLLPEVDSAAASGLESWLSDYQRRYSEVYTSELYASGSRSALSVPVVPAIYSEESAVLNGFQILNHFFERTFENRPNTFAFGEDVGKIGDVNQGFAGLQDKFGVERIFDTGIREWTIAGQAIGMAMRGLRPIAEMQYLDYLIYALPALSDDLATVRYRSNGIQIAPAIIRTRGHRLEGIWHAGSPMGMILGALRGIYICTPRNMTQAAGMYNTLLQADDPGLVIECLNGYRLKERLPDNLDSFTVPLGSPEILKEGNDLTIVTYGSCVRVAEEAVHLLAKAGVDVELIDVQTLIPFDLEAVIVHSLKKTNRVIFLDEDVPGGGTAYMMQQVLELQQGYQFLDSQPVTVTAKANRPPYGSDGDYFSKPNPEDIFEAAYLLMRESRPDEYIQRF